VSALAESRQRKENEMEMEIYRGTIVLYNEAKAWGFIKKDFGAEVFFHKSNTAPGFVPRLGVDVWYELAPPIRLGKKDQAVNVRPVGGAL
jgi:cold shock CspA family protein